MIRTFTLAAAALILAACANPGAGYASKHPELSAAHRQILARGEISSGDAVAGMTREQVKLALGEPTSYDKIDGEDVWVYARKTSAGREDFDDLERSGSGTMDQTRSFTQRADFSPHADVEKRTMVFFTGDRATHAQFGQTDR